MSIGGSSNARSPPPWCPPDAEPQQAMALPSGHEPLRLGPLQIEFEDAAPRQRAHAGMPPELMQRQGMLPALMRRQGHPGMPSEHMMRFERVFPELAGAAPQRAREAQGAQGPTHHELPFSGHRAGPQLGARRSGMGVDLFHDLFPGPLVMVEEPGGLSSMGLRGIQEGPFGAPDPLIMDMLQHVPESFQNNMLPLIHSGANSSRRAPASCRADLVKHCGAARSQVHCLGEHREDVSQACRQDVGKSVPFVCSREITRFCSVLQQGILPCLSGRTDDVSGDCKDAVAATQEVITKANTLQSSVVDVRTGAKTVHTPSVAPAAATNKSTPPRGAQPASALALGRSPLPLDGVPAVPAALRAAGAVCALLVLVSQWRCRDHHAGCLAAGRCTRTR
ncbi:unnamed protein product [Prorocentrum cordatum]|uniref:Uncharacterized protein n=2 Tax=Prorocentrum cordatum TaxID=2364126 RepID=A0ABN9WEK5_9DINO|nr:unnamed protein product [Polarella glacialis]